LADYETYKFETFKPFYIILK